MEEPLLAEHLPAKEAFDAVQGDCGLGEGKSVALDKDMDGFLHPFEVETEETTEEGEVDPDPLPSGRHKRAEGRCVTVTAVVSLAGPGGKGQGALSFKREDSGRVGRGEVRRFPARERRWSEGIVG